MKGFNRLGSTFCIYSQSMNVVENYGSHTRFSNNLTKQPTDNLNSMIGFVTDGCGCQRVLYSMRKKRAQTLETRYQINIEFNGVGESSKV